MPADWTIAFDDMLLRRGQQACCVLCDARPVFWQDVVEVGLLSLIYVVCEACHRRELQTVQAEVRQVLEQRYAGLA